jgi:hypothetical protein
MVLLHGTLDACIIEGRNLEEAYYGCMLRFRSSCRGCLRHRATPPASGGDEKDQGGTRACYVVVNAGKQHVSCTQALKPR